MCDVLCLVQLLRPIVYNGKLKFVPVVSLFCLKFGQELPKSSFFFITTLMQSVTMLTNP